MWKKNKNHIVIIGGYHKASSLANSLLEKGYQVTLVNKNEEHCEKLAEIEGAFVIFGDGCKRFVLEEAGVSSCQIAIALTDSDETNLVICEMCKKFFQVKKTVSLLKDPSKTRFFYQMGIDRVVCAINMITNIMEDQAILDEMQSHISVETKGIHIQEVPILRNSWAVGKQLQELNFPRELIVGCILRDGQSVIPRGDSYIQAGDVLIVITTQRSFINEIMA